MIYLEQYFGSAPSGKEFPMLGDYLFYIGTFGIPSMGFCILIGTIASLFLCYYARRFSPLDWDSEILDGVIWAVIGGFIGMKLLYWAVTPDVLSSFFSAPTWRGLWELVTTGMVFYGGLLGGVAGVLLLCRKRKKNFFSFSDLILPCFCIAHAGGRIGCLLVGCCYGVAKGELCLAGSHTYQGTFAVTYANGIQRLPVPLMEAIFLVLLSAVLLLILRNNRHRGTVTAWYLILYAVWRFFIEFFRGDEIRGIYGIFSTSQWIGIAILAAGIAVLVLSRKWPKDEPFQEFHESDFHVPPKDDPASDLSASESGTDNAEEACLQEEICSVENYPAAAGSTDTPSADSDSGPGAAEDTDTPSADSDSDPGAPEDTDAPSVGSDSDSDAAEIADKPSADSDVK